MNAQKYRIDLGSAIEADLSDRPAETAPPAPAAKAPPGLPSGPPEPMSAEEVTAVPKKERKQLNAGVPPGLDLHRRTALYRMLHGVDAQDQVALALDAWLRDQGV